MNVADSKRIQAGQHFDEGQGVFAPQSGIFLTLTLNVPLPQHTLIEQTLAAIRFTAGSIPNFEIDIDRDSSRR